MSAPESQSIEDRYRAPALEKGLDILELLAAQPDGMSQGAIARALGRSPNEIYRMLATLVRRRFLTRLPPDDRYALSLRMFAISQRHPPLSRLIDIAQPLMRDVTKIAWQSCHLGMESDGDIVIVASVAAPGNWGLSLRVGSVVGLVNTGTGRVLAAFRPLDEAKQMLARHMPALGEPDMDPAQYFERLAQIRATGYEVMASDTTLGVTNLAFPIFDPHGKAIAVVSCPYLERIDAFCVPGINEVQQIYAELADHLTEHYGGARPNEKG